MVTSERTMIVGNFSLAPERRLYKNIKNKRNTAEYNTKYELTKKKNKYMENTPELESTGQKFLWYIMRCLEFFEAFRNYIFVPCFLAASQVRNAVLYSITSMFGKIFITIG